MVISSCCCFVSFALEVIAPTAAVVGRDLGFDLKNIVFLRQEYRKSLFLLVLWAAVILDPI